jgi:hypothetical protein
VERLSATNCYRFASYLFAFWTGDDRYQDGITLDKVWDLYVLIIAFGNFFRMR